MRTFEGFVFYLALVGDETDAQHRVHLHERVLDSNRRNVIKVYHVIGIATTTLVDHVQNVAVNLTQTAGDLTECTGLVLVENTQARTLGICEFGQQGLRVVHRVAYNTMLDEL